jgi:hypothetical protein
MSQKQKKTAKLTKKQFNLIVGINKNLQDQKTKIETDGIEVQEDDPEAENDDWEDEWNSADWLN